MVSKLIVIAGIIITFIILQLDNYEKDSLGLLQLVIIDFMTLIITYIIVLLTKKKSKFCHLSLIAIIIVHILLFANVSGWSASSMSGRVYIIPFLKNATDTLVALIMFSGFFLFIPLILYGLFIAALRDIFCKILNAPSKT